MATKKSAKRKSAARRTRASASSSKSASHIVNGASVTRFHPEGESTQNFSSEKAALEYAATLPK